MKLRFKRLGRRNLPFYRLCAMDARTRRDGRPIEELGFYDPLLKDPAKQVQIDLERVSYWLSVGAQPSDTVLKLVARAGVAVPAHLTQRAAQIAKQREQQKAKKTAKAAQKQANVAANAASNAKKPEAATEAPKAE